jgi:transcriptional regulator with XRE-family HTH domain
MNNLKMYRKEKGITQIRLSIEAGVSQETISAYESGKALPSAETLIKLSNYLNVSIDFLLDLTSNPIRNYDVENNEDNKFLSLYKSLNKEQREDIMKYMQIRKQM